MVLPIKRFYKRGQTDLTLEKLNQRTDISYRSLINVLRQTILDGGCIDSGLAHSLIDRANLNVHQLTAIVSVMEQGYETFGIAARRDPLKSPIAQKYDSVRRYAESKMDFLRAKRSIGEL